MVDKLSEVTIPFFFRLINEKHVSTFGCWLLPEKFSVCSKNNGFVRLRGLQRPPSPPASWLVRLCSAAVGCA